jgi:hypothetical protein
MAHVDDHEGGAAHGRSTAVQDIFIQEGGVVWISPGGAG